MVKKSDVSRSCGRVSLSCQDKFWWCISQFSGCYTFPCLELGLSFPAVCLCSLCSFLEISRGRLGSRSLLLHMQYQDSCSWLWSGSWSQCLFAMNSASQKIEQPSMICFVFFLCVVLLAASILVPRNSKTFQLRTGGTGAEVRARVDS